MEKYTNQNRSNTELKGFKGVSEKQRQVLRKKKFKVSRELDNYYCSTIHNRAWWPNGLYITKRAYGYSQIGLSHFYEKNNIEQLRNITEVNAQPKKIQRNYLEFDFQEENDFTVTIEYCANCKEHKVHTQHSEELYKNFALRLQRCITQRFPFIKVLLKPIDTDIVKEENYEFPKVEKNGRPYSAIIYTNDKFKEIRIGAMEIQISTKKNKQSLPEIALIHSKLLTGKWPKISKILDKIVSFLPVFQGQIIVYEKDDENDDINDNNEQEELKENKISNNRLEGLQVNIYLLKNETVEQLIADADKEIESDINPKKRIERDKIRKNTEKEKMGNTKRREETTPILTRPKSSSLRITTSQNFERTNSYSNSNYSNKHFANKAESTNLIIKGKCLISKYTNEEGIIDIGPLPYDSYCIEVVESNHFMSRMEPLTFNKVLPFENTIKKFIGLYMQEKAVLNLIIYNSSNDKKGNEEVNELEGAVVTLRTCKEEDGANFLDEKDIKLKIEEKKKGLFEIIVEKGRYLLEVSKDGYEIVRKYCDLVKGLNNVNIKMTREKIYNLKIIVYNFEKMINSNNQIPIKNAEITIFKSHQEILIDGITNKLGLYEYEIAKNEDYLTVVVSKMGYYTVQRQFIKHQNLPLNKKNQYDIEMFIYLVKESFIRDSTKYIMITYSSYINKKSVNFTLNKKESDSCII